MLGQTLREVDLYSRVQLVLTVCVPLAFLLIPWWTDQSDIARDVLNAILSAIGTYVVFEPHKLARRFNSVTELIHNTNATLSSASVDLQDHARTSEETIIRLDDTARKLTDLTEDVVSKHDSLYRFVDQISGIRFATEEFEKHLDLGERLELETQMIVATRQYSAAWSMHASKMKLSRKEKLTIAAWQIFFRDLLGSQTEEAKQGSIFVSPRVYTEMVFDIGQRFVKMAAPSERIVLLLITGMLPHEFYNWPQMVGAKVPTGLRSLPFVWDGAEGYFPRLRDLRESLDLRRSILVRDSGSSSTRIRTLFSSLKTDQELYAHRESLIYDTPLTASQLRALELDKVFAGVTDSQYDLRSNADFLDLDRKRFFPIGTKESFAESWLRPEVSLWRKYAEELHTQIDYATFFSLNDGHYDLVSRLFAPTPSLPEIAIFGVRGNAAHDSPIEWVFGFRGKLRPYTERVRIGLIGDISDGSDFRKLANLIVNNGRKLVVA